jgi:predicted nuclease with TOPRIM domain
VVNSYFPSFTCYFLTIFPFLLDENAEPKSQYSELNSRFHELEIEYRSLENEREELAFTYKEI